MNGASLRRTAAACMVGMWACQELKITLPGTSPIAAAVGLIGVALFAVHFVVALSVARVSHRVMIVSVTVLAVVIALFYGVSKALLSGIQSAVLFAAFLGVMQMLRVALDLNPGMATIRSQFASLSAPDQHDALLLRTHLISAILAAGALAAVAPLHDEARPDAERRRFAESALQGLGLAVLWSPFFVAMAICTRLLPDLPLISAVGDGIAMAGIGLLLSHGLYGGSVRLASLKPLLRVVIEVVVLAGAIVTANHVWGIGSLEAAVLGIPVVSAWLARADIRRQARTVARRWVDSLGSIAVEALVVGVAMVLAEVIRTLLSSGLITVPHVAQAWPLPLLIALPPLVMLATSFVGVHPIISASCLLPALSAVNRLDSVVAAGSVLLGWMLCVVLSGFVVPVMFAANLFAVNHRHLTIGRNLRFCSAYVPLAICYLWALNTYMQGLGH